MVWKSEFDELFFFYTQDSIRVCYQDNYAMRLFYIYIYIYHTLHTLFGPLNLMS